jgi:hypothetical protein
MRHSPLLQLYPPTDFEIGQTHGMRIALRAKRDPTRAGYVADLSALRRRLFVGRDVPSFLAEQNISAPTGLMEYRELDGGAVIARVHRHQYLLIDGIASASAHDDVFALEAQRHGDVLVVDYEAAEIACGGPHVEAIVAELCPMDVAAVKPNSWIATRFAHCELALRRIEEPSHYRVLCTPADARFVFGILSEVTRERDGAVLGFDDFRALLNRGD